jgi:translation initiation factor IF-3
LVSPSTLTVCRRSFINRYFGRPRDNDDTPINEMIRAPRVRVIDEEKGMVGVLTAQEARERAMLAGLDLVMIAPNADPPVCRIMDYGKFKYEKAKKEKEAKKKQHVVHLKEIKLHPKTDEHDYSFKIEHAKKFLIRGDRVKVTVVFRGREITHIEFGREMIKRAEEDLLQVATIEQSCKMEGRNMISIFIPDKIKTKEALRKMELEGKKEEPAETDE